MEESKKKFSFLEDWLTLLSANQKIIFYVLIGLILASIGVLYYKSGVSPTKASKIEITNPSSSPEISDKTIKVQIVGAIEKPGVYEMKMDDRIDDLLTISGGLSANANREWVDKNINLASKLFDGQKIYIYQLGEEIAKNTGVIQGVNSSQSVESSDPSGLTNINTASLTELDKLPGIGQVYGQNIIEYRPYSVLEDLVKKGAIPQKTFDKIKNLITI